MEIKLGKRLNELREEKGLTQEQLAVELGVNSVTYLRYEKSQRTPPLEFIVKVAKYYGVSLDYLFGINDY